MAAEDKRVTRVLFCGFDFPSSQEYTREYLQDYSFIEVDDVALDEIPNVIAKYDMCVVKNRIFDANLVTSAVKMKLMMQFGVGLEGVDIDAATKLNIKVGKIPARTSGNASSCAELAIYLMLGLLRKQREMEMSIKQKKLGQPTGQILHGKTVDVRGRVFSWASAGASGFRSINKGTPYAAQAAALNVIRAARGQGVKWAKVMIKGTGRGGDVALRAILKRFGAIGIELARRLRPFGVKIIAIKRNWSLNDAMLQNGEIDGLVDQKGLPQDIYEFAGEADIVVTCLTLYSETVGIVDDKFLSSLRKGSFVVNVARGGILDYTSVLQHLNSGHLGGLAIDVAWTEPFDSEDPILKFPNVLITPHVAGVTEFSYRKMAKVVADTAIQLHEGSPITGLEFVN